MEYIAHYDSPLGPLTLSADEAGLTGISFAAPEKVTDDNAVLTQAKRWLDAYFRGETPDPASVSLSLKGNVINLSTIKFSSNSADICWICAFSPSFQSDLGALVPLHSLSVFLFLGIVAHAL